jgi:hypothetical protein
MLPEVHCVAHRKLLAQLYGIDIIKLYINAEECSD